MKHFSRDKNNQLYLIYKCRCYILARYTSRNNEFERGLKYRLFEEFYSDNFGEYFNHYICSVSSIKQAENIIFGGKQK